MYRSLLNWRWFILFDQTLGHFYEKLTPNLLSVNCGKIGSSPIMGCEDLISLVILYMIMVTEIISMLSWLEISSQIQRKPLQIQFFFLIHNYELTLVCD